MSFITRTSRGRTLAPASGMSVIVVSGPDTGARVEVREGSVLIGTLPSCDLVLTDPTVSRQHVRLELRKDGLHAVDLKSRNGVLFNGTPIQDVVVPPGGRLRVGDTELRFDPLGVERPVPGSATEFQGLGGVSSAMREVIDTLRKAAPGAATVLLHGETGTGKEVAARAIHRGSGRKGELVVFDCSAAAPGVIASELFGHVRGAFTDAKVDRIGAAVQADGGTLFLDEIGELDPSLQPALLRLLETKEVRPVGSNKSRKVDVRVVAASHRDLQREVEEGRFRRDLLFRLAVVTVHLPPLRERMDDLPLLAAKLLEDAGLNLELSESVLATLRGYAWPGNIRELRNVLLRTATLGGQPDLTGAPARPAPEQPPAKARPEPASGEEALPTDYRRARESMMARFEKEYVQSLLNQNKRNIAQAARNAGIARGHLYRLMKKHGLG